MLDIGLHCGVCGLDAQVEGVESPLHVQGMLDAWAGAHQHNEMELKMYHDAEVAVREYEIDKGLEEEPA